MNSNRIAFLGIGQCGNNIVGEFEAKGYNTLAINTSDLDLKTANVSKKYAIPGALGCARDRKKALGYFRNNYNRIFNEVENSFSEQDIVFVVFSLGGGTGAGIGPILIDSLSRKYPDKKFCAIVAAASVDESIQTKINNIETYNDIISINNLRSIFILDNNSNSNKLDINTEFVNYFDSVLKMDKPNKNGVIDESEIEKLLTCKGTSIIVKLVSRGGNLELGESNSIFLDYDKGCKYMGVSLSSDCDISVLENEFGRPSDVFKGYNDSENVLIVSGMGYPLNYFKKLDKDIEDFRKESLNEKKEVSNIDTSKYKEIVTDFKPIKEFDFDALYKSYKGE